jgi:Zn-finger nucleic acid-binding protein
MNCPKCQGSMRTVDHEEITVDRCTKCGGLWFDLLEHEDLKGKSGSERIDSGDPAQGRKHDDQAKVMCPIDNVRMIRMVDAAQPHIWFESCPVCHGAFFRCRRVYRLQGTDSDRDVPRPETQEATLAQRHLTRACSRRAGPARGATRAAPSGGAAKES